MAFKYDFEKFKLVLRLLYEKNSLASFEVQKMASANHELLQFKDLDLAFYFDLIASDELVYCYHNGATLAKDKIPVSLFRGVFINPNDLQLMLHLSEKGLQMLRYCYSEEGKRLSTDNPLPMEFYERMRLFKEHEFRQNILNKNA